MERLQYLLDRYQQQQCTDAELDELNEWFHVQDAGAESMQQWLQEAGGAPALQQEMISQFRQRVQQRAIPIYQRRWVRTTAAAAVLVGGLTLVWAPWKKQVTQPVVQTNNVATPTIPPIAPGSGKATLKLADGSTVALTDSSIVQIAMQNNTRVQQVGKDVIAYTNNPVQPAGTPLVYNTLSTPRGGSYHIQLADGTAVTLDALSSITYPVNFTGKERRVTITGQVYFEVTHDAQQPFRVVAKDQLIEDVGTAFNVTAYDDDPYLKVTLVEGKVNLQTASETAAVLPGQQAMVKDRQGDIQIKTVNIAEAIAWKNGRFIFHKESIQHILKQAARWYDVEIVYENNINKQLGGNISRYVPMTELLENLKLAGGIQYRIDNRKIIITK